MRERLCGEQPAAELGTEEFLKSQAPRLRPCAGLTAPRRLRDTAWPAHGEWNSGEER